MINIKTFSDVPYLRNLGKEILPVIMLSFNKLPNCYQTTVHTPCPAPWLGACCGLCNNCHLNITYLY